MIKSRKKDRKQKNRKQKNRKQKNRKIIFGSDWSETNYEPTFLVTQKKDKIEKKISKDYFWLIIVWN